jgi:putative methionine-R-sulfoxide reductase with GAF domain
MTINTTPGSNDTAAHNKRTRSLSLRNRLLITFILLAALPVLATGVVSGLINAQGLRSAALDQLASIAQLKTTEIAAWISSLQINLDLTLQGNNLLDNTNAIIQNSAGVDAAKTELRNKFIKTNKTAGYFDELFIIDGNGTVILSTNVQQEGKIFETQTFYREGLKGAYVTPPVYDVSLSKYSILFSQPIINADGAVIAVIAGRANLAVVDKIMAERAGLGETGETYLVGSNYALLSQLRFGDAKIGETYIRTNGTTKAIDAKTTGSELYTDYRNTPVLGSYLWIPELQVAMLAEHDQSEALQASNQASLITGILMVLTLVIAAIVAFLVTRSIVTPISQLVVIAENISSGNLELNADVRRADEIGVLAAAFNTMTNRLRELIGTLEQRVADRTKALATSSAVSRRLSTILNRKELVAEVVDQVKNAFGYYHTQIYFYDEANENLVMAGGTGEAGEMMLAQFHKVASGRGLVGRAAENNQAVLVSNTLQNTEWLPNALLPETKSEAAIPISIGNKVLGVLDVQHNIADGLQQEDIDSLQSIANQVAVALQNIQSTEIVAKRAAELQTVANISTAAATIGNIEEMLQEVVHLTQRGFGLYHAHVFTYNENTAELEIAACGYKEGDEHEGTHGTTVIPLGQEQSLVARAGRTRQAVIVNDVRNEPGWLPNLLLPDTASELAVPLIVGDQLLGVLDVQSERINAFSNEDASIQSTLASQVATALQNARSFSQTQHQAEREIMVNLITQKIQNTTSVEAALQIAARELGHALGMKSTLVALAPSALAGEQKEGAHND